MSLAAQVPNDFELQPSGYQGYCKTPNPQAFESFDHFWIFLVCICWH
jgi:hypothetical protein